MVIEVQAHRDALVIHPDPVGPRGIDHEQVVVGRELGQGLAGDEPAQVVRDGLAVAEDRLGAQRAQEAHERGGGADGVAVGAHVGGHGDHFEALQEVRYLASRIIGFDLH